MAGICGGGNPAESEADRNLLRFRTIKLWVHRARVGEARQRTAMRRCDVPDPALTDRKVFRLAGQVRERNKHTGEPQTLFVCVRACSVVSDSLQPHGRYPARLLCPWDFPGKNTGVGCHFLTPGDLPDPEIKPTPPAVSCVIGGFFTTELPGKPSQRH